MLLANRCLLYLLAVTSALVVYKVLIPEDVPEDFAMFALAKRTRARFLPLHLLVKGNLTKPGEIIPNALPLSTEISPHRREENASVHFMIESEIASRFEKRRQTLQTACEHHSNSPRFRKMRRRSITLYPRPPLMNLTVVYCPIQKTSSTTWKRIFSSIGNLARTEQKSTSKSKPKLDPPQKRTEVSFAFVREPYGRLVSAYVDKLFSPNTMFWRKNGLYILSHFRQHDGVISNQSSCGQDVTFPEFIKYIIHMQKTGIKRDGHFVPTHDHCDFCKRPYQYIGHLETLKEDMAYILKAMQSPVHYDKTFDSETLRGNTHMVLRSMRNKVQECMSLDQACRRLWKKWQIRGIISKTQSFPLTREQTRNISVEDFLQVGLNALSASGPKWQRGSQKKEALREAFRSVPLEDRLQIQNLLFLDFELFGFDPKPDEVFPKEPFQLDPNFSYYDLYK